MHEPPDATCPWCGATNCTMHLHLQPCDGKQGKVEAGLGPADAFARTSDPATSHEAAATCKAAKLEALAVATLGRTPHALTTLEMADLNGLNRDSFSPRMSPLRKKGLVMKCGRRPTTGTHTAIAWALVGSPVAEAWLAEQARARAREQDDGDDTPTVHA